VTWRVDRLDANRAEVHGAAVRQRLVRVIGLGGRMDVDGATVVLRKATMA